MFKPADPKVSFPQLEESILKFWEENKIFKKSLDQREGSEEYVFFDGPPFATGLPHFGHFVPGTIKDIFPRYYTMKGKRVERRFGWDCHGLPVEFEMEKQLGISGKSQIEEYGIAKFNENCRSIVLRYTSEWEKIVGRMGRWVDFENDYKTMDPEYMESIWWVVKQLWDKGLVYEGHSIHAYSPKLSTVLSNFEVNLGGYKEVTDPAVTIRFKVDGQDNTYFLAWTTTPWTLPSNLGLCFGPDIDYVKVKDGKDYYILAEARLNAYYKDPADYEIVDKYKGIDLKGMSYEPLMPYFADLKEQGAFRTYVDEYVTIEDGTGIVHTAPGFGEDDNRIMKGSGVPVVCPIDAECKFTDEVPEYKGIFVKDADNAIIKRLREEGKLIKRENYLHNYPHCYRTKGPLIYRAISSWFVDVEKIKDKMLKANDQIRWMPDHIQKGRFGKWLENAREWSIGRSRYWGNPIPVWKNDETGEMICIGSLDELEKYSGQRPKDLHKHFVDEITWEGSSGGTFRRVPDVLDCWFESGSMPYAQVHYPFENKERFEKNFPANFINEGLDQTRGWFYTLTILAAALFDSPAFQNVIVSGLVLAEDGKKMSKSERNFTDPVQVINKFGADALRLYLMDSAVVRADDLKYSDDGVKDSLKSTILPLWNAYSFFVTYANIDGFVPKGLTELPDNPLDCWILSESEKLLEVFEENMAKLEIQKALSPIVDFIDSLNNWYIRRSRRRFWKSENDKDKFQAYETLYYVLMKVITVACPIVPFITEAIYQNLRTSDMPLSIHLQDFPTVNTSYRDVNLEKKMSVTRQTVSMGRAIRSLHNLKIRQPLKALHLVTKDMKERSILREMEDIISEELNVKEVIYRENEDELVEYSAKANFKVLGKQLGKDMKEAAAKIETLKGEEIQSLLEGATLSIDLTNRSVDLTKDSVIVIRTEKENLKVLNEGSLTVALDPDITDELLKEGLVRDLVRGFQNLRKERDLQVTDRINVSFVGPELLQDAVNEFEGYFLGEILGADWSWNKSATAVSVQVGDDEAFIDLVKE
ncbi:isoleucine--tRNA ligase [Spirochaeta cellobiosiphila]|uniref:isoleucine--tRNA ligase n=1 Tax=Spirochaeta cellobiosiphila TaxID=504483 RepID=UPI00042875D4|nr:isoleucine--tRNA ligase [Spirochaeta cellobiosiphila]